MTRRVKVGNLYIGGGEPITVQSMTNTPTLDYARTLAQIEALEKAGCDIVRIAVSSDEEVGACRKIIGKTRAPLVADIQFDYRHAVACADIGFDKIRFNPGYVGDKNKIAEVVAACKRNGVPIRVGVNSGSVEKRVLEKFSGAAALAESALYHVAILEELGFYDTVISVKSSSVRETVEAYEYLSGKCDYPLHLGVTESGSALRGAVKSSVGIGSLLLKGIGDTIRVSLTGDPCEEVRVAKLILGSLGLRDNGVEIVSCPTCSRCEYDAEKLVRTLENATSDLKKQIKIAVMGCVVNGPGEAKNADVAVCGGKSGKIALYVRGDYVKTIDESEAENAVLAVIDEL